jgi:asparagine synthase (glutamine-hydrolysing)
MCGIAGLLGAEPGSFAERVRPAITHRGPDDAGTWQDASICLDDCKSFLKFDFSASETV